VEFEELRMDRVKALLKNPALWIGIALALLSLFIPIPYKFIALASSPLPPLLTYIFAVLRRRRVLVGVDEELLYVVAHMYAVSTGRPPRERLFELGSVSGLGYGEYSAVLTRIATLAKRWGYGFIKAIRIQAERVSNPLFRDFLIRLSEAMNVGEDLERFLGTEFKSILAEYEANYTRVLEAVKMLLGIYTASISSALFIIVNMILIALLIFGGVTLVISAFLGTIIALAVLVYMIRKALPREKLVHELRVNIPERRLYAYTLLVAVTLGTVIGLGIFRLFKDPSYFMMSFGALLLVPGLVGRKIERKIKNTDTFFVVFIRSFGLTLSSVRNYASALRSLLRTEFGELTRPLKRLYARIINGVDKKVSWLYFIGETGSETVRRCLDIFYDSMEAGGDSTRVGMVLGTLTQRIITLRKQREQVAKAFEGTVYVLHILIVALTEFMMSLIGLFQQLIASLSTAAPITIFNVATIPPEMLLAMKIVLVFSLTLLNAFAMKSASGGFSGTAWIHASILLMLSGITMILASRFAELLVQMFNIENMGLTVPQG